jgi:hypothetical protein
MLFVPRQEESAGDLSSAWLALATAELLGDAQ